MLRWFSCEIILDREQERAHSGPGLSAHLFWWKPWSMSISSSVGVEPHTALRKESTSHLPKASPGQPKHAWDFDSLKKVDEWGKKFRKECLITQHFSDLHSQCRWTPLLKIASSTSWFAYAHTARPKTPSQKRGKDKANHLPNSQNRPREGILTALSGTGFGDIPVALEVFGPIKPEIALWRSLLGSLLIFSMVGTIPQNLVLSAILKSRKMKAK